MSSALSREWAAVKAVLGAEGCQFGGRAGWPGVSVGAV